MRRPLSLILALFLAACALPVHAPLPEPVARGLPVDAALAPFEDQARLPPEIAGLPYGPGRAYAILVQLPAPGIVDLSDPQRTHHGLGAFLNPLAVRRAGTSVGHAMIGWHCADGHAGLASKTGDSRGRGYAMLRQGWGLGALLATYDDGHLLTLATMPARHRRAIRGGQARIVALEIDEAGCQRMRRALAGYLREDTSRYTLLPVPDRPWGDACAGFALWLLAEGGAAGDLPRHLTRELVLRDSFVGRGRDPGPGLAPHETGAAAPLPLLRLLAGDWGQGAEVGRVSMLDMELLLAALERAQLRAGVPRAPRLDASDPVTAAALEAATRWTARWPLAEAVTTGRATAAILRRQ